MPLSPDMTIHQRVAVIAEALARVLDRHPVISVEATGPASTDLGIYVLSEAYSDARTCIEIDDLAREMEALL